MLIAMAGLFFVDTKTAHIRMYCPRGFGNSNIFPDGKKIGGTHLWGSG